jgi:hypothetical protein
MKINVAFYISKQTEFVVKFTIIIFLRDTAGNIKGDYSEDGGQEMN